MDVAVPIQRKLNVRVGANGLNYSRTFNKDNVGYKGRLAMRSVQATLDYFPFGGNFHLSPGMLLYNGTKVDASAAVPGGQTFDLGSTTYLSSTTDPLRGSANLRVKRVAPMFLFGFGNLVPRSHRHLIVSIEAGAIYQGQANIGLNFGGSACDSSGLNCASVISDPTFQSNVIKEQQKLQRNVSLIRFYPVVAFSIGWRF
jgi:hypothetical protein